MFVGNELLHGSSVLLDPQVISAFVVGVFSALSAFCGWLTSRGRRTERNKIRINQLSCFYEPLDHLLSFKQGNSPQHILGEITELMEKQYRHATPDIQNEIMKLVRKDDLVNNDFSELQKMTSSIYNWLRRSLGYPYDKKKIIYDYLPRSVGTLYSLIDYISWIAYIVSLILGLGAIGFAFTLIPAMVYETLTNILLLIFLALVIYLLTWMAIHIPKINKQKTEAEATK
jgi:hypothetical protein